jgi:hypothetical protein
MALDQKQQVFRVVKPETRVKQTRRHRRPRHSFNLKTKPYAIVPFMIAPVLPGETLDNALLQARIVTDPIQNPLIGWWKEYYFFYVKHRSLDGLSAPTATMSATLQSMMLSAATDVSALKAAANDTAYYNFKGGMEFTKACTEVCVEEFFRHEDHAHSVDLIDGYPQAYVDQGNLFESLKTEAGTGDDEELPGVDLLEEASGNILTGFTSQYDQWEIMRDLGLTDVTYDDYLRSNGVDVPKALDEGDTPDVRHRPELLRYTRQWQYPSNHVDPTTGVPTSAVSWSVAERLDKKRYFREPGFIFGLTVCRPKIYMGLQKGAGVGLLNSAYLWSPGVLKDHPYISVVECPNSATDGILQSVGTDVWFDVADLLEHGDQFVNFAASVAQNHGVSLPSSATDGYHYFASNSDITALFVTAGTEYIREDGLVSLDILTKTQRETT